MSERVINKVTSTSGNLPPVLLDLTSDTVNERNLERDQTAHNSGGQKITGQLAIEDAEAWARGTRNGTPVGPTDETYNNNSKYYSIVSGSIMQMAGQQAIAAATSANNAAESERAAGISESNAANSERAAENSAIVSGSCMNIAGVHAGDAEAWAIGKRNGQLVPPTDPTYENNSLHYKEVCESIAGSLASVLKPKGTCLFVNLPTIADSQPGDTWNIEDEFTTTSDFREGAGKLVEAGANVYLTIDNKWDVLAGTTSDYIGATASTAAVHGLVPAAQAGDQDKALLGNGTWGDVIPDDMTGATSTTDGAHGLVPAPQAGDEDKVLSGDGTFKNIIDMIYPINSVYISMTNTNPGTRWKGTTWELLSDGYLRNNAADATGGSSTSGSTTLTANQIPSHSHTFTTGSYGNHTHTLTTGSYGNHTHTATTQSTGAHTHTAKTGSYGSHNHHFISRSGGTKADLGTIVIGGQDTVTSNNSGFVGSTTGWWSGHKIAAYPYTADGGAHTHTLTTGSYGNHSHTLTTQNTGAHTHTATTQNTGAHTHTGTTQAIGGGQGHTHSIEPSYVRIYAYKRTA